ncbi:MAG: PIN domain-containing protein [Rubricoccaceae bacterium]
MRRRVLLDTGPLVASLDRSELNHKWSVEAMQRHSAPLLTCDAVIVEAVYILRSKNIDPKPLFELLICGAVSVVYSLQQEIEPIQQLMEQYADTPMDLADACLVRMSELYPESLFLTLDSDFYTYRRNRTEAIDVIRP